MMTVAAARLLADGTVCFVGIGLPSTVANLARRLHAPGCVLIYESGCIGSKPRRLPLSIGDGELAETADAVVSVPEIFAYWLQAGRVSLGFLGAAQIDRFGNINSTVIGPYEQPAVRLPGAGGRARDRGIGGRGVRRDAPDGARAFVEQVDFRTSMGFGDRPGGPGAPGPAGPGPVGRGHRPRHPAARSRHERAGADRPAPRRHTGAGGRRHGLGAAAGAPLGRTAAAHRPGADRPAGAAGGMTPAFVYDALAGRVVFGDGARGRRCRRGVDRLGGRRVLPGRRRPGEGRRRRRSDAARRPAGVRAGTRSPSTCPSELAERARQAAAAQPAPTCS